MNIKYISYHQMVLHSMENFGNYRVEIFLGKKLNIKNNLEESQKIKLIKMLQIHSSSYAWEYIDLKGIDLKTCMHHIYIQENVKLVRQP